MKKIGVIFIIISFAACKKFGTEPVTDDPNNSANSVYGDLQLRVIKEYKKNILIGSDSVVISSFYDKPTDGFTPFNYVNAGNVSFNSVVLKPSSTYYKDTTHLINIHNQNSVWLVSGNANVAAFSHTFTPSFPVFSGNAQLLDSMSLFHGCTINISGLSNMTEAPIPVTISDGTTNITKSVLINQNSITFSPQDLSALSPTESGGSLIITFSRVSNQTLGGKLYGIINTLQHIKHGVKLKQ